ncbi:hypothetical protein [Pseudomonas sp. JAI120]|uniref:hypothetical protein n=1 Tax=Pseudomonas sp. JAI120 TaxID=2723063 RepID=UPI000F7CF980|nr:hypothetical protein EJJ20_28080 [Pseudomonas poae]
MNGSICDVLPVKLEMVALLSKITDADARRQVLGLQGEVLSFLWRLETDEGVPSPDIENVGVVLRSALEARFYQLTLPKN